MYKRVLLGFTNDNEIAFADVSIKRDYFSVCFDTSYPKAINESDIKQRIEGYIECMDKEWILDKLESYDCKPSQLAEFIYRDSYDVIEDFFDNSYYTESFQIDGIENDIYFLASAGGQHDTREVGMKWCVNTELYNAIHEMWDKYHLKNLNDVPTNEIDELFEAIEHQNNTIDEYAIVKQWLENNFK